MIKVYNYNGFPITIVYDTPFIQQGWGDWTAKQLKRLHITAWKGCGCAKRRRWLNELGWKWQKFFKLKH